MAVSLAVQPRLASLPRSHTNMHPLPHKDCSSRLNSGLSLLDPSLLLEKATERGLQ